MREAQDIAARAWQHAPAPIDHALSKVMLHI
jgi:hypothetical protein